MERFCEWLTLTSRSSDGGTRIFRSPDHTGAEGSLGARDLSLGPIGPRPSNRQTQRPSVRPDTSAEAPITKGCDWMKNVQMTAEGNILTIKVDLSKEFGPSSSGKTIIVASTEGNAAIPDREEKVGLNVYRKK